MRPSEMVYHNRLCRYLLLLYDMHTDFYRLRGEFSHFDEFDHLICSAHKRLSQYHDAYIAEVSVSSMAISTKLSAFLLALCELVKPTFIADLGSGFSTFVLRHYAIHSDARVVVHTVDDSPEWLEKTRSFLRRHDLPDDNLTTFDSFEVSGYKGYDLILHDLGSMKTREQTVRYAIGLARSGGYIIIDDMHFITYSRVVKEIVKSSRDGLFSLRHFTKDEGRRFSSLVVKRSVA